MLFSRSVLLAVSGLLTLSTAVSAAPTKQKIPSYVLKYAPMVYLHSEEEYYPSDVATFLKHVVPKGDDKTLAKKVTFQNLAKFSNETALTSKEPAYDDPAFLRAEDCRPDKKGRSKAEVTIVIAPKGGDTVDAFYFFFYAYNQGKTVGTEFGDHVGDWEQVMIRFVGGKPKIIYLSQHSFGKALEWDGLDFVKKTRPKVYSAKGSHGSYSTADSQRYAAVLIDETDEGIMWDITRNYRAYNFDSESGQFSFAGAGGPVAKHAAKDGTDWMLYKGRWGDEQYPDWQEGQSCTFGQCHYVGGPTGPYMKNLGRKEVCENESECNVE